MKHVYWTTLLLVLFAAPAVAQHHHDDNEKRKDREAEVRVYLADKDKKPVSLASMDATLVLTTADGTKKVRKATRVVPPEGEKKGLGHGGEVRKMDEYFVELVVRKPHGEHGHKEKDATPYFGLQVGLDELTFSAVVIFRIRGKTYNVKGFEYPPAVRNNYKDAVARVEEHLKAIQALIDTNELEKVHAVAERISYVCEKLPDLAPHDDKVDVEKTCKAVIALFSEIDEAADAGKKRETIQVFSKYKLKVAELKKHVKGEGHNHHEDGTSKTTRSLRVTYFYLPGCATCAKVQRGVSALPKEFGHRVSVENVDATTSRAKRVVKELGFGKHGLVVRDDAGKVLFKQKDHTVKMKDVRNAIKEHGSG